MIKIYQVDAFTEAPFMGNPAAVCVLEKEMTDEWMQNVAALGASAFTGLVFRGRAVGRIFNPEPEVVRVVGLYLAIVSAGYGLQGILTISANAFSAMGKPYRSAALNLVRMFALYIPIALLGSRLFGLPGVFAGAPVSAAVAGALGGWWALRTLSKAGGSAPTPSTR